MICNVLIICIILIKKLIGRSFTQYCDDIIFVIIVLYLSNNVKLILLLGL